MHCACVPQNVWWEMLWVPRGKRSQKKWPPLSDGWSKTPTFFLRMLFLSLPFVSLASPPPFRYVLLFFPFAYSFRLFSLFGTQKRQSAGRTSTGQSSEWAAAARKKGGTNGGTERERKSQSNGEGSGRWEAISNSDFCGPNEIQKNGEISKKCFSVLCPLVFL